MLSRKGPHLQLVSIFLPASASLPPRRISEDETGGANLSASRCWSSSWLPLPGSGLYLLCGDIP